MMGRMETPLLQTTMIDLQPHPMSEGQQRKAWRVVGDQREPIRAEDMMIGDFVAIEGENDVLVVSVKPVKAVDGPGWDCKFITAAQFDLLKADVLELKDNDGTVIDLLGMIREHGRTAK